jgi:hypothetical protein
MAFPGHISDYFTVVCFDRSYSFKKHVFAFEAVGRLKQAVAQATNVPVAMQIMTCNGRVLFNHDILAYVIHNFGNMRSVQIYMRIRSDMHSDMHSVFKQYTQSTTQSNN